MIPSWWKKDFNPIDWSDVAENGATSRFLYMKGGHVTISSSTSRGSCIQLVEGQNSALILL